MRIHFWDDPMEHNERAAFRSTLDSTFSINTSIDINDIIDANVIFVHGSNGNSLRGNLEGVLLVTFGGNPTEQNTIQGNRVSYINADELTDRFDQIYSAIERTTNLSIEKLYEIIFDIDPILEGFLKPFANANPFNDDQTLKTAKATLKGYVDKL